MLTKSEKEVMKFLWSAGKPLSCTEIIELSEEKTWKDSYVHALINSLISDEQNGRKKEKCKKKTGSREISSNKTKPYAKSVQLC